ncbi:MAG: S-layer homology domain-containing protein [Clostridiales bacterium]|nr:S-layer homology domain-containing protein [Clostridiales bacterium]
MRKFTLKRISAVTAAVFMTAALNSVLAEENSAAASSYIEEAEELGLFEAGFSENSDEGFTLEEFKAAAANLLDKWNGSHSAGEINKIFDVPEITDNTVLTREQGAKLLYNTLNVGTDVISKAEADDENGVNGIFMPRIFADGDEIDSFARREIYTIYNLGVMTADSENNFAPGESLTKDEAVQAFLNLYNTKANSDKVEIPAAEAFPAAQNMLKYYADSDTYSLDASYMWNSEGYEYEPVYYDAFGGVHQATDEGYGYVYPFDKEYMFVWTATGVGVNYYIYIDKYKNEYRSLPQEYLDKKAEEEEKQEEAEKARALAENEYNLTTISGKPGGYQVIDALGNVVKTFYLDPDEYEIISTYRTNMLFQHPGDETHTYLYRAYSGITVDLDVSNMYFTQDGYIIAKDGPYGWLPFKKCYFCDKSGNVMHDFAEMGYTGLKPISTKDTYGRYFVGNYIYLTKETAAGETLYDIVTMDGTVIEMNAPALDIVKSKDGMYAVRSSDNAVDFYDCRGDKLGSVSLDNEVAASSLRWVSGILRVSVKGGNYYYYTPFGEPAVKNAWIIREE